MNRLKRGGLVVGGLYFLYVVKSAVGIDISSRYHAIDIVKIPVKYALSKFPAAWPGHKCGCDIPSRR